MKNIVKTALTGTIVFSMGLLLVYGTAEPCANQGIVQGQKACDTPQACANYKSVDTCKSAFTYVYFPATGSKNGYYIDTDSAECTTAVTCEWTSEGTCQVVDGSKGDTANKPKATEHTCQ